MLWAAVTHTVLILSSAAWISNPKGPNRSRDPRTQESRNLISDPNSWPYDSHMPLVFFNIVHKCPILPPSYHRYWRSLLTWRSRWKREKTKNKCFFRIFFFWALKTPLTPGKRLATAKVEPEVHEGKRTCQMKPLKSGSHPRCKRICFAGLFPYWKGLRVIERVLLFPSI